MLIKNTTVNLFAK